MRKRKISLSVSAIPRLPQEIEVDPSPVLEEFARKFEELVQEKEGKVFVSGVEIRDIKCLNYFPVVRFETEIVNSVRFGTAIVKSDGFRLLLVGHLKDNAFRKDLRTPTECFYGYVEGKWWSMDDKVLRCQNGDLMVDAGRVTRLATQLTYQSTGVDLAEWVSGGSVTQAIERAIRHWRAILQQWAEGWNDALKKEAKVALTPVMYEVEVRLLRKEPEEGISLV